MQDSPAELLRDWHDFYMLVGTASATLVGLTFVATSIGSRIFDEKRSAATGAFLTPTVVHFSAALFACLVIMIPNHTWASLAGLLVVGGLAGTLYSGRILSEIVVRDRYSIDLTDRMFYALLPMIGYLVIMVAAVLMVLKTSASLDVMAAGLLILLLAAIRNAWDMMLWIVIKSPGGN